MLKHQMGEGSLYCCTVRIASKDALLVSAWVLEAFSPQHEAVSELRQMTWVSKAFWDCVGIEILSLLRCHHNQSARTLLLAYV